MTYDIIIPVYNGETTVGPLFDKIKTFFLDNGSDFKVLFVYDCGPDNSWQVLKQLKQQHPALITLIKLSRNYGQHNAIICGIEHSNADFVITMDEDLQHDPKDIDALISKQIEEDYDVVYGKYDSREHSILRNSGSWFLKRMISKGIPDIHPDYSAFRLIRRDIAKALVTMQNSYTFLDGYISWVTTHCTSCMVSHAPRQGGESAYNFKKLIGHTINIFVTFSNYPLRLVTYSSILIFLVTSLYSAYVIYRTLVYDDFAMGFPSLIISIGFGFSFVLLTLGIIGEYIYRINLKTTKRPNYYTSEIL